MNIGNCVVVVDWLVDDGATLKHETTYSNQSGTTSAMALFRAKAGLSKKSQEPW
jgi:hypothetical protein